MHYFFTSESVSEGHPDKVSDQISDAILDNMLAQDPAAHVACETLCTTGQVVIAGEVKSEAYVDLQDIARRTINRIGYTRSDYMFGLEFNFYNCFQKTISKIEITVIPVDAKGRLQRDRFNRDERTIRCMGPVLPGAPAQYTFDELFWDESGRITYLRVIELTFHFTDGSRKSYNGHDKILKHTLNP